MIWHQGRFGLGLLDWHSFYSHFACWKASQGGAENGAAKKEEKTDGEIEVLMLSQAWQHPSTNVFRETVVKGRLVDGSLAMNAQISRQFMKFPWP